MSTTTKRLLILKASDGVTFEIEEAMVTTKFLSVKNMVEHLRCNGDDNNNSVITLGNVNSKFLGIMLEWCKKHASDNDCNNNNNEDDNHKNEVKMWDEEFVKDLDHATLYHLLLAADNVLATELVDLLTLKMVNMIKGKKVEEIRQIFNVKNDFTPEKEEESRRKSPWAFE